MNEIELWEQEIIEDAQMKYMSLEEQIDFLTESLDQFGEILNEEDDDVENYNKLEKDTVLTTIRAKLVEVLIKLGDLISNLILKIRSFIKTKIKDFKAKHIVEKFKNGKINEKQLAEKLTKGKHIFNPNLVFDAYMGAIGEVANAIKDLESSPTYKVAIVNGVRKETMPTEREQEMCHKLVEAVMKKVDLIHIEDIQKIIDYIDKKNDSDIPSEYKGMIMSFDSDNDLREKLVDVAIDTSSYMKKFRGLIEYMKNSVVNLKQIAEKVEDKERIRYIKSMIKAFKSVINAITKVSNMFMKQIMYLESIMIGYVANAEKETSYETLPEEEGDDDEEDFDPDFDFDDE